MWKPLEEPADVPPLGTGETATLDFKAQYEDDSFETAKDVAAFANAQGGTVLIGAAGGDRVLKFRPLEPKEARQAARLIDEAVRDRCRPAPIYTVEELGFESGLLLAVNVWPMPGQLVGVRIKPSELACGRTHSQPQDVFFFPLRVGTHTRPITPEQIAMFLDAKVRRVAIGLERAAGQRCVLVAAKYRNENASWLATAVVKSVSLIDNVVELTADGANGTTDVAIPLDSVVSVCKSQKGWHLYLDGVIKPVDWLPDQPDELKALDHFFDPRG